MKKNIKKEKKHSLPKNWEVVEFEKCLEKVTYTNKIQRKDFKEEGIYPIISQEKDFINGYWDNEEDLFKVDKPVVIFGDHTKIIKFIDFDFVLGADGVKILKPKDKIDSKYFYYFLQNVDLGNLGYARHYRLLKETNIAYPKSLSEQRRIVSILDKCFSAIERSRNNAEQNLKNAKEIFESYLNRVFAGSTDIKTKHKNWEEKKLGEVCTIERGSSPRPINKYQTNSPDGVNWIKIGDTKGVDKYIYTTKEKITKQGAKKSRYVKEGDFILSNSMSFGKPYIMKTDGYIHDGWFVFRLPDYLDKNYFYYLFTSHNVQEQIQSLGAGAIVKNISSDLVKKVDVFFPKSKEEQQTIVHKLDTLRIETQKLESIYQKKILLLEELKKSILQKAFSGELN